MPAAKQQKKEPQSLEAVIDGVIDLGRQREGEKVSIGDIQSRIGQRSFGPFLFIAAVCEISPLGGVPGLPTLLAAIVALCSVQMLLGQERFWIPGLLRNRAVSGQKLQSGLQRIKPAMRWLDKVIRPRLGWATEKSCVRILAVLCLTLAASVPPLELLPFASSVPFAAIGLFGLGLTARDGYVVLAGLVVALAGLFLAFRSLLGG